MEAQILLMARWYPWSSLPLCIITNEIYFYRFVYKNRETQIADISTTISWKTNRIIKCVVVLMVAGFAPNVELESFFRRLVCWCWSVITLFAAPRDVQLSVGFSVSDMEYAWLPFLGWYTGGV